MNAWAWLAWLLAGFITGVAVTSAVMWFGRGRIRARPAGPAPLRLPVPGDTCRPAPPAATVRLGGGYRPDPVAARFPGLPAPFRPGGGSP